MTNTNITIVLRNIVKDSDDIFDSVKKKAALLRKKGRPSFRNKKYENKEDYIHDFKKACLLDAIFSYAMYEIERDFLDTSIENTKLHILSNVKNPQSKMRNIYILNSLLYDCLEMYENDTFGQDDVGKETAFFLTYSVFLTMLDELKGTSKENKIDEYKMLFETIFSVK